DGVLKNVPPIVIFGPLETLDMLSGAGLFRGLLLLAQAALPATSVAVSLEKTSADWSVDWSETGPAHLLIYGAVGYADRWRRIRDRGKLVARASRSLAKTRRLKICLPTEGSLPPALQVEDLCRCIEHMIAKGSPVRPARTPGDDYQAPLQQFAWKQHCVRFDTTFPLADPDETPWIAFAVPWLGLGGTDQCVV